VLSTDKNVIAHNNILVNDKVIARYKILLLILK
jgi:hypothetical protein